MNAIIKDVKRITKYRYIGCGPQMEEVISAILVENDNEEKWYTICVLMEQLAFFKSDISIFDIFSKDTEDITEEEEDKAQQYLVDLGLDEDGELEFVEYVDLIPTIPDTLTRNVLLTLVDLYNIELDELYNEKSDKFDNNKLIGKVLD